MPERCRFSAIVPRRSLKNKEKKLDTLLTEAGLGHIFVISNFCHKQLLTSTRGKPTVIDLCGIRKIQTALRHFEDTLRNETGLSLNDAMCLCAVSKGIQEPGSIAREMELSPSRLTRILDALETRSLVERKTADGDRRSVLVTLTPSGREVLNTYECANLDIPDVLAATHT